VEVLAPQQKTRRVAISASSLEQQVEQRLRTGFITQYAGGFLLLAYHLELGSWSLLQALDGQKEQGLPGRKLGLQWVHEGLFGIDRIAELDGLRDDGFDMLNGLPFIVSPASEYRYFENLQTHAVYDFLCAMGQRRQALGFFDGQIVNFDGHCRRTFTQVKMPKTWMTKLQQGAKAIRVYVSQDQITREPVMLTWGYSGYTVGMATPNLAATTRRILGQEFLSVMDAEYCVGQLLHYLDHDLRLRVLVPVKQNPSRCREMEEIPGDQFQRVCQQLEIAQVQTRLKDFSGKLTLLVERVQEEDGQFRYVGFLSTDERSARELLLEVYPRRWRIENWFKENDFLGIDSFPCLELNGIGASLALKLLAYNIFSAFRTDLGGAFSRMQPQTLYQDFLRHVQGKVQLRNQEIEVTLYGHPQQEVLAPRFHCLKKKLEAKNIDPRVPWLNNYPLRFLFR
jgi:hypothetical protein